MKNNMTIERIAALHADYFTIYKQLLEEGLTPDSPAYETSLSDSIDTITHSLHGKGARARNYSFRKKLTLGLGSKPTRARVVAIMDTMLRNEIPLSRANEAISILDERDCHHIDEDKWNDSPSNLILLDSSTHGRMRGLETGLAIEVIAAARITLRTALASVA